MDSLLETVRTQVASPRARAALALLLALLCARALDWGVVRVLKRLAKRSESDFDDRLVELFRGPILKTVLLAGLWVAGRELGLEDVQLLWVKRILATTGILVWTVFAFRFLHLLLDGWSRNPERARFVEERTLPLFDNLGRVLVFAFCAYALITVWDLDASGWLASAGIAGLAVGFAAQDSLANLFAGVFIIADAPYRLGDFVILDSGERGRVAHIGLRSTRLVTQDDVEITIPNAVMGQAKITNESGGPRTRYRVRIKVGVAYGSDLDQVRAALMAAAGQVEMISARPEARVRFRAFGDSSLDFELLCWISDPALRGRAIDALNSAVYRSFADAGIEIPFPQRDLWIKERPASVPD